MLSINRYKLGGNLLAVGAGIALLVKAYWLIIPNESPFSMAYRFVGSIFGQWFARLVMPPTIEGTTLEFSWTSLIWIPWAAVFIAFLLWVAVKVIRGQFKSDLVPLPVLGILGSWFIFALLYEKISNGFNFFGFDLKWLLPELLSDFAIIAMIVGIALIVFNYKKAIASAIDEIPRTGDMKTILIVCSVTQILFSLLAVIGNLSSENSNILSFIFILLIFISGILGISIARKEKKIALFVSVNILILLFLILAIISILILNPGIMQPLVTILFFVLFLSSLFGIISSVGLSKSRRKFTATQGLFNSQDSNT